MRVFGLFRLALHRLVNQFGLAVCLGLGIAVAIMLASAIPLFSNAVQLRVLQNRVEDGEQASRRPAFAFMLGYYGSISGPIDHEDYLKDDAFISKRFPELLQLPITQTVRHIHTPKFRLFPAERASQYANSNTQLEWLSVGTLSDFAKHIQVFGQLPQSRTDGVIEALAYVELANQIGLQAGEDYVLYGAPARNAPPIQQRFHISGIWAEKDQNDPYWFYRPDAFSDSLMVTEADYIAQVAPLIPNDTELGLWYFLADGSSLDTERVLPLLGRMNRLATELTAQREGIAIRVSPVQALQRYVAATNELTLLLSIFSVPLLAVVLYFIIMVAGMVVREQEGEIAVLRSRGASAGAIALLYLLQMILIGAAAFGLGMVGGILLASAMTRLTSFLALDPNPPLPITFTVQASRFGAGALVVAMLAALLPAVAAARRTIVGYRSSQARNLRLPLWQRMYLDVILLIAGAYVYFQLRQSGGLLLTTVSGRTANPFSDPVRFLVPVLMLAAAALVLVRFFPWLMRGLAALAGSLPMGTASLLALRSLSRASGSYTGPLLLLIFTMGLAVFSSSIALTLDQHLTDATYFRVGADVRLIETGDSNKPSGPFGGFGTDAGTTQSEVLQPGDEEEEPQYYTFVPVQEHLRIPGVRTAARVGAFGVRTIARVDDGVKTEFIGIDRVDFQRTAFFREDFASQSLGALMNQLALKPDGILVSRNFLRRNALRVGEPLQLDMNTALVSGRPISFTIVGTYDIFPYPTPGERPELFVGNLDYFFEIAGTALPYDVLLSVEPDADLNKIVDQAGTLGFLVLNGEDARQNILAAKAQPERRGMFGLLSAGFIAASMLTIVGFVLSAIITFRSRRVQLGMLRTIGLSATQMAAFVVLEQVLLIGLGALAGSGLGIVVSQLFVPFMQVGGALAATTPPFIVRIAWQDLTLIYASLAAALFVALGIMLISLRRLQAFEAVKLGAV
jgi:putative ABC transport system permease protein